MIGFAAALLIGELCCWSSEVLFTFLSNSVHLKMLWNNLQTPRERGVEFSKILKCTVFWWIVFGLFVSLKMYLLCPQFEYLKRDVGVAKVSPPMLHNPGYYNRNRGVGLGQLWRDNTEFIATFSKKQRDDINKKRLMEDKAKLIEFIKNSRKRKPVNSPYGDRMWKGLNK